MTSGVDVHVKGMKELQKELDQFPLKVKKKIARPAVTKSVTPLVKVAKKNTPRGKGLRPNGQKRKHLKQTIIKKITTYPNGTVFAAVGPEYGPAPHSHLVHDGTDPHQITTDSVLAIQPKRKNGKVTFTRTVEHPGSKDVPFLGMAFDSTSSEVMRTLAKGISDGIAKEYAKQAAA